MSATWQHERGRRLLVLEYIQSFYPCVRVGERRGDAGGATAVEAGDRAVDEESAVDDCSELGLPR